jgi:hypothetical protein
MRRFGAWGKPPRARTARPRSEAFRSTLPQRCVGSQSTTGNRCRGLAAARDGARDLVVASHRADLDHQALDCQQTGAAPGHSSSRASRSIPAAAAAGALEGRPGRVPPRPALCRNAGIHGRSAAAGPRPDREHPGLGHGARFTGGATIRRAGAATLEAFHKGQLSAASQRPFVRM